MARATEGYTITIDGPDHKFKRAVDEAIANSVISFIMSGAVLPQGPAGSAGANAGRPTPNDQGGGTLTPKQFLKQKKPGTQYERIACIAYYLTEFRSMPQFVTADITALNTEAAEAPILNPSKIVNDTSLKYRYITGAGDRNKQITTLGEALVEALPDRDAVKTALAENRPAKKRKKRVSKKKK